MAVARHTIRLAEIPATESLEPVPAVLRFFRQHTGIGITVSWGCGMDQRRLVRQARQSPSDSVLRELNQLRLLKLGPDRKELVAEQLRRESADFAGYPSVSIGYPPVRMGNPRDPRDLENALSVWQPCSGRGLLESRQHNHAAWRVSARWTSAGVR